MSAAIEKWGFFAHPPKKDPGRSGVLSCERQRRWRRGRLPLPQLSDDALDRPQWGHVDREAFINLQLHEPVSDDSDDLVGVGDVYCCHQVDPLGSTTLLDDEGR